MKDTILFGDCKDTLSEFLPQSARTCVTSPPYYGLRDYGTATWVGGDPNCKHRKVGKQGSNCITGHKNHDDMGSVGDYIFKSVFHLNKIVTLLIAMVIKKHNIITTSNCLCLI